MAFLREVKGGRLTRLYRIKIELWGSVQKAKTQRKQRDTVQE
jgi:hypothetical protein